MIDFYGKKLPVWKANLHTHTTNSDSKFTPEETIELYRAAGYDVLALTDHRRTNTVSGLDGNGMLLVSGIEMHPPGPRAISWHLLAVGVPEDFPYDETAGAQTLLDRANAAGAVCFAAHPYWCGFTASEVKSLRGFVGLEVYNASTRRIGKSLNMQIWDEILDSGIHYNAIAVDDIHREEHALKGWTMIASEERTLPAILNALRNGHYYASTGPEITRLSLEDGVFKAEFSPCAEAILMSNKNTGFGLIEGDFTSLEFDISNWPKGNYMRLQIKDAAGNYAWSNPVVIS